MFIRRNKRLLHLNLSGIFKLASQVKQIVKSIKTSETLLSVHLSHTPIIPRDKQLQAYIRQKLNMNMLLHKPKNKFSTKETLGADLKSNWVEADQMHTECELESKIAQYFGNLRIREVTVLVDDLLIL